MAQACAAMVGDGRRAKSCPPARWYDSRRTQMGGKAVPSGPAGPVLGCHLRAYDDERTGERAPRAGDGSLVDNRHRTSARTTVCADKHFILVALRSACGGLAVGTSNADGAVSCKWRHRAGRPRGTFRALRAGRSQWTSRPRRTGLTFFTSRAYRAGIPLGAGRALSTACHANRNGDRYGNYFDMHHAPRSYRRRGRWSWAPCTPFS